MPSTVLGSGDTAISMTKVLASWDSLAGRGETETVSMQRATAGARSILRPRDPSREARVVLKPKGGARVRERGAKCSQAEGTGLQLTSWFQPFLAIYLQIEFPPHRIAVKSKCRAAWVAQRFSAAFSSEHDPGDLGSSPAPSMEPASPSACVSASLYLSIS